MEKNLRKTFSICLQSEIQDLYSTYFGFLQSSIQKQGESVYKKWVGMPGKNEAYILSISKSETKRKLQELLEKSNWEEKKKNNLQWKDIIVDEQLIRVIMYDQEINNQLQALQAKDFKDYVIIHNVGSDQYQIQEQSLNSGCSIQMYSKPAANQQNNNNNNNNQNEKGQFNLSQNYSDNNNNNNINNLDNQETHQNQIKELKEKIQKKKQKIINYKQKILDQDKEFQNLIKTIEFFKQQAQEDKQINDLLKQENEKLKRTNQSNSDKDVLIQQLKQQLTETDQQLSEMRTKYQIFQQQQCNENEQLQQENFENIEKNIQLIRDINDLKKSQKEDQSQILKLEQKYQTKKNKYIKIKQSLKEQTQVFNQEFSKVRSEIIYLQEKIHQKTEDFAQIHNELQYSISQKDKYYQKYLNIKEKCDKLKGKHAPINYERSIFQSVNLGEVTPLVKFEEKLNHRTELRDNIQKSKNLAYQSIQKDSISNSKIQNNNFEQSQQQSSLLKSSVGDKSSLNKDSTSYAAVATLQSEIKIQENKSMYQENQSYSQLLTPSQIRTIQQQKEFNQRLLVNQQGIDEQSISYCLNQYEQQLNFSRISENEISYSKLLSDEQSEIISGTFQDVSEFNIDGQLDSVKKNVQMNNNNNNNKSHKKKNISKYKARSAAPSKQSHLTNQQNKQKIINNKYRKEKYLQQKKLKEQVLCKSITKQVQSKPHLKERIEEEQLKKANKSKKQNITQEKQPFNQNLSFKTLLLTNKSHLKKEIRK